LKDLNIRGEGEGQQQKEIGGKEEEDLSSICPHETIGRLDLFTGMLRTTSIKPATI
jgi:hypothetical protein